MDRLARAHVAHQGRGGDLGRVACASVLLAVYFLALQLCFNKFWCTEYLKEF